MNWWQYLLLVNVYLVLFFGFYALLLRRETFFQLNRLYLVCAALLSFFIPLIQSDWVQNLFITQTVHYKIYGSQAVVIYELKPIASAPFNMGQLLAVVYFAGVLFLAARLVWQLISLKRIINQPGEAAPYSFFKKIKLDRNNTENDIIAVHEQVHAKQWHSADVLIIEAVMIINWFNPVVYLYRYAIKHIHEFIADSHTLKAGTDKADYALLLLSQTFNAPQHQLVSNFFNKSLLKQRIMMLQKNRSQRIALIKYGLSAPLFILMLVLSSATVNNSKAITKVNKVALKVFELPANTLILSKITAVNAANSDSTVSQKAPVTIQGNLSRLTAAVKPAEKSATGLTTVSVTKDAAAADTIPKETAPVFTAVEVEPSFSGPGTFSNFLAANVKYPHDMVENNIQGKVIVTFIVERDGSVSGIKVLREPGYGAGDEAARVIALTKWHPGIQNGRRVRTQFTVPVNFALSSDNAENGSSSSAKPDTTGKRFTIKLLPGNGPLYVVDGKEMDPSFDLKLLDANDISSINILKGATAKALYGSKGANGVIVIRLKNSKRRPILSGQ